LTRIKSEGSRALPSRSTSYTGLLDHQLQWSGTLVAALVSDTTWAGEARRKWTFFHLAKTKRRKEYKCVRQRSFLPACWWNTARNWRPRDAYCATRGESDGNVRHCHRHITGGRRESDACQIRARSSRRFGAGRKRWTHWFTFL